MGNTSCTLCKKTSLVSSCIIMPRSSYSCHARRGKVVKVVRTDGKVMTFIAPIFVKDVLARLSGSSGGGGGGSGISLSKEADSEHLASDYKLKIGKVYYELQRLSSEQSAKDETSGGGIKRIKIVITKQQLKELLAKQISVDEVLSGIEKTSADHHSAEHWKPNLESIPEGVEGLSS